MLNNHIDIDIAPLSEYFAELKLANEKIWDAENLLRIAEDNANYDEYFIKAARDAFIYNTKRHGIKQKINAYFQSDILEEKQYG